MCSNPSRGPLGRRDSGPARVASFPPLVGAAPRILLLGTMPGIASLAARAYYAHPRNVFWRLMGDIYEFDADGPYRARTAALTGAGVAVWDVLATCVRSGSLDAAIEPATARANDFAGLLARHPSIARIVFNGAQAQAFFAAQVADSIAWAHPELRRVPSSSPANARLTYPAKLAQWRAALA